MLKLGMIKQIWKKKTNKNQDPIAPEQPSISKKEEAWSSYDPDVTVISVGMVCKELNMRTGQDLIVLGRVQGTIECASLFISEGAIVNGNIKAKRIVCAGRLHGKIEADLIVARKSSTLTGEIACKSFGASNDCKISAQIITENLSRAQDNESILSLAAPDINLSGENPLHNIVKLERVAS